jgi:SET domain-containing protein
VVRLERFGLEHVEPGVTDVAAAERGRIWFYANRDIDNGEELLFDYGFDPRRDAKRQLFESVGVG